MIDDPNATAADLEDAMAAYQDVIDQTKTQRDNTKSSATDAIASAEDSDLVSRPRRTRCEIRCVGRRHAEPLMPTVLTL